MDNKYQELLEIDELLSALLGAVEIYVKPCLEREGDKNKLKLLEVDVLEMENILIENRKLLELYHRYILN